AEFGSQKPKSLSVRINADGSGNSVRLRFRDSKGQVFQVNGGVMSKTGPQNMTFDLTGKDASHWGGPDDGKINYPIQLESLVIDGTRAACGPFSVDVFSPVVVYDSDGKE
ncbi:MAG: hypothetical protein FWC50_01270, partial [Planctomycetaceae bacterium]|nr:hypothetical protein [Planctomycetaceae bacterium]